MDDSERNGSWLQTWSGSRFWPLDPRPEEVFLEDVVHSLCQQRRFGGHALYGYSVGDHSVRVAELVVRWMTEAAMYDAAACRRGGLLALLHDAPEAYVVDVPRPLKRWLVGYAEIEAGVLAAVHAAFGITATDVGLYEHYVHRADEVLLATEARDLAAPPRVAWGLTAAPLPEVVVPRDDARAVRDFYAAFRAYGGRGA